MINPIRIATDGYLPRNVLGMATRGYLSTAEEIIVEAFRHTENLLSQIINRIALRSRLWLSQ